MDGDLSSTDGLLALACKPEKAVLFPVFARMALKILLLPIGTGSQPLWSDPFLPSTESLILNAAVCFKTTLTCS